MMWLAKALFLASFPPPVLVNRLDAELLVLSLGILGYLLWHDEHGHVSSLYLGQHLDHPDVLDPLDYLLEQV